MSSKIKFAVVGAGRIGKRHASMVQVNDAAELVATIDVNSDLKDELEEEFNVPYFESIEAFVESKIEVDVIKICTPNYLHAPQALIALNNKLSCSG